MLSRFDKAQFTREGVRILSNQGVQEFAFSELAEIHLPPRDFWDTYYHALVAISPEGKSRLERFVTADGLVATGSFARRRVEAVGDAAEPRNWQHLVQPAWCVDPLWVAFGQIAYYESFAPEEVPLVRVEPIEKNPSIKYSWILEAEEKKLAKN